MTLRAAALLLVLAVAGCLPAVRPEARLPEADALLASAARWPAGRLLLRQSATVVAGGRTIAMDGVLEIDPAAGAVRLVALDPMGIKLFDVAVRAGGEAEVRGEPFPAAARAIPAVSESLGRIYLTPASGPATGLARRDDGTVVSIARRPLAETWVLDGASGRPKRRVVSGRGTDWEVSYGAWIGSGANAVPGEIVLTDREAGYRLEIRTIEVLRDDE